MRREIETILRAKHDPAFPGLEEWEVVVTHRGALNNEKVLDGSNITRVKKSGFHVRTTKSGFHVRTNFIPCHRIKRLRRKTTP